MVLTIIFVVVMFIISMMSDARLEIILELNNKRLHVTGDVIGRTEILLGIGVLLFTLLTELLFAGLHEHRIARYVIIAGVGLYVGVSAIVRGSRPQNSSALEEADSVDDAGPAPRSRSIIQPDSPDGAQGHQSQPAGHEPVVSGGPVFSDSDGDAGPAPRSRSGAQPGSPDAPISDAPSSDAPSSGAPEQARHGH